MQWEEKKERTIQGGWKEEHGTARHYCLSSSLSCDCLRLRGVFFWIWIGNTFVSYCLSLVSHKDCTHTSSSLQLESSTSSAENSLSVKCTQQDICCKIREKANHFFFIGLLSTPWVHHVPCETYFLAKHVRVYEPLPQCALFQFGKWTQ